MDTLTVTSSNRWSASDFRASVTDKGGVVFWHHFEDIDQDRYKVVCTDKEWDRLVAWVEWQRMNK